MPSAALGLALMESCLSPKEFRTAGAMTAPADLQRWCSTRVRLELPLLVSAVV